jgi:hypothetical protein
MSQTKIAFALLFLASPGMAATIAEANCDQVSDSETAEATCNWGYFGSNGVGSTSNASATADYNSLSAYANSMWCLGSSSGDPDCEPSARVIEAGTMKTINLHRTLEAFENDLSTEARAI